MRVVAYIKTHKSLLENAETSIIIVRNAYYDLIKEIKIPGHVVRNRKVQFSDQNGDDFIHNLVTILIKADRIKAPAFVTGRLRRSHNRFRNRYIRS